MLDFKKIISVCDESSRISESFIDDFLINFISDKEGLEEKFSRQLSNYRKIISKMPEGFSGMLMSQLIAHRIFQQNGLAGKYINHAEIRKRSAKELVFFQFQMQYPWKYTFCSIVEDLLHDLYRMKDAISGEEFMLYSPGVSKAVTKLGCYPSLWLFLVGFNGECCQTFGPIAYFRGIQSFDLFFFAKHLNADITFLNEVPDMIELNPVPFLMLWSGGEIPVTYHKKDMVVFNKSEYYVKDFSLEKYADDFLIEKKHPIYMLSLKRWNSFPHFAKCFYHAKKNLLILTSMTARGYDSLVSTLNKHGNDFPTTPDILCTMAMIHIAKEVLNFNIEMNPYEKHFAKTTSPETQQELDKINVFLRSLMDKINNKKDYDIAKLALKADISLENAENIEKTVLKKFSDDSWKR